MFVFYLHHVHARCRVWQLAVAVGGHEAWHAAARSLEDRVQRAEDALQEEVRVRQGSDRGLNRD